MTILPGGGAVTRAGTLNRSFTVGIAMLKGQS